MAFAIAYIGPNAANLGNIGIDYWRYEIIDDLLAYFNGAILMTIVDAMVIALTFFVLWKLIKIDVLEKVIEAIKTFGPSAAIYLVNCIIPVTLHSYLFIPNLHSYKT